MTRSAVLAIVIALLLGATFCELAAAQPSQFSCKSCDYDAYGQAICVIGGGPPAGKICGVTLQCYDGSCYYVCGTSNDCMYA